MKLFATATALISAFAAASAETYSAKVLIDATNNQCTLIKPLGVTQLHRAIQKSEDIHEERTTRQNRNSIEEMKAMEQFDAQYFLEIYGGSENVVQKRLQEKCPQGINEEQPQMYEEDGQINEKIVDSGDPKNRIDVVFMGDGYTASEQTRFFDDMKRLTKDMFSGETFAQYLPLFNIWAVFLPSQESGVGVGGSPKKTAFGLYRDGTELRGLYTSNSWKARNVCNAVGPNACDFPSLIGNDDFYGGLGGEFVISTRSPTSGTIVLRHEMGHNFGKVGEEYDGGYVYDGANNAPSLSQITWKHWLTEPSKLTEQKGVQLYQKHIWYDLKQGAFKISFTSTGKYKRSWIQFSASGVDTDDSLKVTLDGKPLAWKSSGVKDRSFYSWRNNTSGFSAGNHQLVVEAGGSFSGSIIKQLCNAVIYEYMDESEYRLEDQDYIGIYPTYDIKKVKSYRPDDESCLMRNMLSTKFCRVCQENMWHKFMERIEFIDEVVVNGKQAEAKLIPLGQFRASDDAFLRSNPEVAANEKYTITWLKDGKEETQFKDQNKVDLSKVSSPNGQWTVRVVFQTPNVRVDPKNYMQSEKKFTVA